MEFTNKIVVLICYFGDFPWYFSYFIHSCKFNNSIDFYIFTDTATDQQMPKNVKLLKMSKIDFTSLASKKLGFKINIESSYKLCDFKPSYGLIFQDFIKGYDFWGQSDIDVIYGDIRGFMSDAVLNCYDYISVRHDYTTGCFSLYRNNDLMNNIFRRSKDYKFVLQSPKHFCFDECNFAWDELTMGKSIFEVETEIESFTHIIMQAQTNDEIRAHFDFLLLEGLIGRIKFINGKVVFKNSFEGILYHLYWLKSVYFPKKVPKIIRSTYRISGNKIYFHK